MRPSSYPREHRAWLTHGVPHLLLKSMLLKRFRLALPMPSASGRPRAVVLSGRARGRDLHVTVSKLIARSVTEGILCWARYRRVLFVYAIGE